jgi:hypothetical protein
MIVASGTITSVASLLVLVMLLPLEATLAGTLKAVLEVLLLLVLGVTRSATMTSASMSSKSFLD